MTLLHIPGALSEKHMSLSDVKQQFSRVVNEVARGESSIIVEKHRRPVVAIVSYRDYQDFLGKAGKRDIMEAPPLPEDGLSAVAENEADYRA